MLNEYFNKIMRCLFQPFRVCCYLFCCMVHLPRTWSRFSPADFLSGPLKAHPPWTARAGVSIAKTSQGRRAGQGILWHRLLRLRKQALLLPTAATSGSQAWTEGPYSWRYL